MFLKPDAVIFDLDGTLLDTEPVYTAATQAVVGQFGKNFDLPLKKKVVGRDSRAAAKTVITELRLPISVDEFLDLRDPILQELLRAAPEIMGAGKFIANLKAKKCTIGLATGSPKHLCDIKLSGHDWRNSFDSFIFGDDDRIGAPKPAPDIYLLSAKEMNVPPRSCLVFEDSPSGVEGALAAEMRVIAIDSQYVADGALDKAHHIIKDYHDALLQQVC